MFIKFVFVFSFLSLRELKKADSQVATYDFPPKKTVGNKADKVVEERRKRLQAYLRRIVNLLVATNPALSAKPDKESVLLLMPFFSESAYLPEDQQGASSPASAPVISPAARTSSGHFRGQGRSQSQGRSIFNRRRSTNQAAVTPQLAL